MRTHTHIHTVPGIASTISPAFSAYTYTSPESQSQDPLATAEESSARAHTYTHTQRVTGIASTISPAFSVHTHIHTSENQSRDLLATAEESSA